MSKAKKSKQGPNPIEKLFWLCQSLLGVSKLCGGAEMAPKAPVGASANLPLFVCSHFEVSMNVQSPKVLTSPKPIEMPFWLFQSLLGVSKVCGGFEMAPKSPVGASVNLPLFVCSHFEVSMNVQSPKVQPSPKLHRNAILVVSITLGCVETVWGC